MRGRRSDEGPFAVGGLPMQVMETEVGRRSLKEAGGARREFEC